MIVQVPENAHDRATVLITSNPDGVNPPDIIEVVVAANGKGKYAVSVRAGSSLEFDADDYGEVLDAPATLLDVEIGG